jgi:hypothetical protein
VPVLAGGIGDSKLIICILSDFLL